MDLCVAEFDDAFDDDDVPALFDTIINHDNDESIDSIDKVIAEEDCLFVDDIKDHLGDLDIHAALWQAYIARKAADTGKSFKVDHKKTKRTTWK